MTVRVPFELRRRASRSAEPASALFVPGRDASELLAACTRLGIDPTGRVHDVAGGFLVRLPRPTAEPVPGATRLRELADGLYIPVDADLVPALLDDEAAGLVRDGGLVFLPGGAVLRFDRTELVGLSTLLTAPPPRRREWRPMPEPPPIADRIVEVSREVPETPLEEMYRAWEKDVRRPGRSRSRPGSGEGRETGSEGEGAGSGRGMMSGLQGLGDAIREMAGRARSMGEKLQWGILDHSSLVKKLLREFRQGDMERALQHSFSMNQADARSKAVPWGNRLPFHQAIYSLLDLLGGPARGGFVGVWQARPDLIEQLRQEYRRAAEKAIQQGDFRRAAYIYGKLLGDHRFAAQALQRGGLHHDAAILYLKKLNDPAAAAQAFEVAGMVDRAVAIYRILELHETAGDLLRRIGDEKGAQIAYLCAVTRATTATPEDWLEAGRILDRKLGSRDDALLAYSLGWSARPAANATPCALEMIGILAHRGEADPLRKLLDAADEFFESSGSDFDASLFYNGMAGTVAAVPELSDFAAEVHDRARSALAGQLRRRIEAGWPPNAVVSSLFSASSRLWTPAFLRDAQFAAATATAADRPIEPETRGARHPQAPGIQVGRGTVTAACQATGSARVFLGFADGRVFAYDPRPNRVVPVGSVKGAVSAMVASPDGDMLVVLRQTEQGATLTTFLGRGDGTYRPPRPDIHSSRSPTWLTPVLPPEPFRFIGLGSDRDLMILDATGGLPMAYPSLGEITRGGEGEAPACACLLPDGPGFRILTHDGPRWVLLDREGRELARSVPTWRPYGGSTSGRCTVPLSWTCLDGLVKVVGLDAHGALHSSHLWFGADTLELETTLVATTPGGYRAAARTGTGKVVAVSAARVDWLSESSRRFQVVHSRTDEGLTGTVACFPSNTSEEVLVVSGEGFLARVAIARGRGRRRG